MHQVGQPMPCSSTCRGPCSDVAVPGAGAAASQQPGKAARRRPHSAQGTQAAVAAQAPPAAQEPGKKRKHQRRTRAKVNPAAEPRVKGEQLSEASSDCSTPPKKQHWRAAVKKEAPAAAVPAVAAAGANGPQYFTWSAADHAAWYNACKAALKAYKQGGAARAQAAAAVQAPAAAPATTVADVGEHGFLRVGAPIAAAASPAPAADAAQIQLDAINQWQAAQLAA